MINETVITIIQGTARKTGSPTFKFKTTETLSTAAFIKELVRNNHYMERSDCVFFLTCLAEGIKEQLSEGKGVKIDGLGIFKPTYSKGVLNVNFLPDRELKRKLRQTKVRIIRPFADEDIP